MSGLHHVNVHTVQREILYHSMVVREAVTHIQYVTHIIM